MKKAIDLRKRVGALIRALQDIPAKHRTPAMQRLLTRMSAAAAEYDSAEDTHEH